MSARTRISYFSLMLGSVGVGIVSISAAQPPNQIGGPVQLMSESSRTSDSLEKMLAEGRAAYSKIRDYTCIFTRQERINGVLSSEQVAEMKVRVKPASIQVRFAKPETVAGMEMTFVAGTRSENMRFRPARAKGLNGFVIVPVDDSKIMAETHHTIKEIGLSATLDRIEQISSREKSMNNPVEVHASDFQFAGRKVIRYEVTTPRPHAHRYAHSQMVYVDKESKLPLRIEAYDAPKSGANIGDLFEMYSYTDVKINVGLGDSAFE